MITTQLGLLLYFRNHKAIKATSLHLSILIFAGCYLLCFSGLLNTILGTFSVMATLVFVLVMAIVVYVNGTSLILFTITIKSLRVYRIFMCADRFHLSKCWKNAPLILIAIFVSLIPNIMIVGLFMNQYFSYISICLFALLELMLLIISFFLAIQMHKIKYKNFKDKSILLLIAYMMINYTVTILTICILNNTNLPIINSQAVLITVQIVSALTLATACQLILFTTKLLPVVHEKLFPDAQTTSVTNVVLPTAAITRENS